MVASVVASASAVAAARFPPRAILLAATAPAVAGIAAVRASTDVLIWLAGLIATAVGIGLANTRSLGVLVTSVAPARIVTAMVVWSQLGIFGYVLGPLTGGTLTQAAGYTARGLIPATAAFGLLLIAVGTRRTTTDERPRRR